MRLCIIFALLLAVGVSIDDPNPDFYRLGQIVGAAFAAMYAVWVIERLCSKGPRGDWER